MIYVTTGVIWHRMVSTLMPIRVIVAMDGKGEIVVRGMRRGGRYAGIDLKPESFFTKVCISLDPALSERDIGVHDGIKAALQLLGWETV